MKLSRLAGAFVLAAAVSLCAPLAASADPLELTPGVRLNVPRLPVVHVDVPLVTATAIAAPLAQVDAGTPLLGDELAPVANALSHAFASDGKVNWIVAAPLLVWLLVFAVRKWVAALIPGKVGDWLRSRIGGLVLGGFTALALAFIDFALTGGALTVSAVLGILIKWAFAWGGSIAGHEAVKNVTQHVGGEASSETAAATLARVSGAGPQP